MNAAVYYEPYKFPAGILAFAVHGAFFALLYFGFNWQTQPATIMNVELWSSLPEQAAAPAPPKTQLVAPPEKPAQPEKVIAPDIALPEKKNTVKLHADEIESKRAAAKKTVKKSAARSTADRQIEREQAMIDKQAARELEEKAAREAKIYAEQAAAKGRVVDEYKSKIQAKIQSNIVMPPNVANDASAEFMVTLLPGGSVLKAVLRKSSKNAAYDNAVERAIRKSDPLPLPPDPQLFNDFREILMSFRPVKPAE